MCLGLPLQYAWGMGEPHILTALIAKYAELQGQLEVNKQEAEMIREGLTHVGATIRLFHEDYPLDTITPHMPRNRNPWFRQGHLMRETLEVLQKATEPMTAREILFAIFKERGVENRDAKAINFLSNAIRGILDRRNGTLVSLVPGSNPKRWSLVSCK